VRWWQVYSFDADRACDLATSALFGWAGVRRTTQPQGAGNGSAFTAIETRRLLELGTLLLSPVRRLQYNGPVEPRIRPVRPALLTTGRRRLAHLMKPHGA
jgi:hypothetical protein